MDCFLKRYFILFKNYPSHIVFLFFIVIPIPIKHTIYFLLICRF